MQAIDRYSLSELPKGSPFSEYRRRLLAQGQPTGIVVHGDDISLQLASGPTTLLATNYDYFDGVRHWLYLIGPGDTLIDAISMPEVFGFIHNVSVASGSEVSFGYFGTNDRWTLQVDVPGFWSWSASALIHRLNRYFLSKRHLRLSRVKGAPWEMPPNG